MTSSPEPVRLLSPGGALEATFLPHLGMVGSSLRHAGEELLGQRGGPEAYAERKSTFGIPLLHPWANRLSAWGYEQGGRSVSLDRSSPVLKADPDSGLPIHGSLAACPYWEVRAAGADGTQAWVEARLDYSAHPELMSVFPFAHRLDFRASVRDSQASIEAAEGSLGGNPRASVKTSEARMGKSIAYARVSGASSRVSVEGSGAFAGASGASGGLSGASARVSGASAMAAGASGGASEASAGAAELSVRLSVTAIGEDPVPISFGFHPYLTLPGGSREDWELSLPVSRRVILDQQGIPAGEHQDLVPGELSGRLGKRTFDDSFDVLSGEPPVLAVADARRRLEVRYDEGFPVAQVYAPEGSKFIAFEPMTAPVDALTSGHDLRFATPGRPFSAQFTIRISSP